MQIIKNEKEFNKLIKDETYIIDCYTEWCGPCKLFSKVFEKSESRYNNMIFYKLNVDKNKILAKKLGIMSVPTVIIFKDGKELKRQTGYMDDDDFNKFIKE